MNLRLLLAAGAVALAPLPAAATELQFGGVTIPSQQTLSPAGHEDIAFRPSCAQLAPVQQGDVVHWTINLSDGQQRVLYRLPPLTQDQAFRELGTAGICKVGGVDVPLIYSSQVPQRQVAVTVATPEVSQVVAPSRPSSRLARTWTVVGGLLVAGLLFGVTRGSGRKNEPQRKATNADVLAEIFGGGR